jgi:hypothetical protein
MTDNKQDTIKPLDDSAINTKKRMEALARGVKNYSRQSRALFPKRLERLPLPAFCKLPVPPPRPVPFSWGDVAPLQGEVKIYAPFMAKYKNCVRWSLSA